MTLFDGAILAAAAFGAGMLNTVAGGGTFLTFPALVFTGIPSVAANATSAVAVFPGYLAGALGFRRELGRVDRARLGRLAAVTLAGGLAGSLLLMVSSNETFSRIVPALLLFATLAFLFGDRLRRLVSGLASGEGARAAAGLFLVSLYGGYFNGGLGIMLLALFSVWGMSDLHEMNGLKNGLSFVLSAISVTAFAAAGLVAWPQAVLMMAASTAVTLAGAPVARLLSRPVRRGLIALVGVGMTAVFALRTWG
ncbi:sulfite exporter TauE/SafE family protein [Albidovulum sp.]|uniref:sulfite exporter TauE/SafE family protein n=1 Tax=Albidovulum sp. TaxID=1872424 RepID=UPI0039B93509